MEIRRGGRSFVMVNAAGVPVQVRFALEEEFPIPFFNLERYGVPKIENLVEFRAKPSEVMAIVFFGNNTSEPVAVARRVAVPCSVPAALDALFWRRRAGHAIPIAIKRRATSEDRHHAGEQRAFNNPF